MGGSLRIKVGGNFVKNFIRYCGKIGHDGGGEGLRLLSERMKNSCVNFGRWADMTPQFQG